MAAGCGAARTRKGQIKLNPRSVGCRGTSTIEPNVGASIGLDFLGGSLLASWADNSPELSGNPDRPNLDVAFAPVATRVAGANVNVTRSTACSRAT